MTRLLVLGALLASSSVLHAQSLGELAKKAQEQRDAPDTKQAAKIYTNKDLKEEPATPFVSSDPLPPPASSSSVPAPAAAIPTTPPPTDYRQVSMKDEAYWKGRRADVQAKIDTDTITLAAMVSRVNSLSSDFNNTRSLTQRMVLRREREEAATEATRLRAAVAADKRAIATLEEEARRIGVPAGWLRP